MGLAHFVCFIVVYGSLTGIHNTMDQKIEYDIVGNGPSSRLWNKTDRPWIQCNIPHHTGTPDGMVIVDFQPIKWMLDNDYKTDCEILATKRAYDFAKNNSMHDINIKCIWRTPRDDGFMNSGQAAVLYHAPKATKLHLWGFDSMYDGITDSKMDDKVPRRRITSLAKQWDGFWLKIFPKFMDVETIIYGKGMAKLGNNYGKNVRYCKMD